MPVRIDPGRAREVANQYDASWEDVAIRAFDSAPLRGWLFTPRQPNRRAVLFVHGRGGTPDACLLTNEEVGPLGASFRSAFVSQEMSQVG